MNRPGNPHIDHQIEPPVKHPIDKAGTSAGLWPDDNSVQGIDPARVDHSALANARAAIVNRTHRVVRERAEQMRAQRSSARSLVLPMVICSALLLMLSYAVWTVLTGSAAAFGTVGTEIEEEAGKLLSGQAMDTGGPVYVLFLWFLPVSAVALGTVMFRRTRGRGNGEVGR